MFIFCLVVCLYTRAGGNARVYAATSSELNFQARLQTASGGIVPDGNYPIQFNLYSVASGGTTEWTENDTVTVRNGYFSVYLGAVTGFPNTIDWSADQWLTMNVNSDGEMNPRILLTSVPYAFRSGQADTLTNGSSTITANNLAQLAPSSIQAVNSALTLLQLNQTGSGALAQFQHSGTDVFTLAANGDLVSKGSGTFAGGTLELGSATQAASLKLNDGAGKKATLQTATLGQNTTYTLPDPGTASVTICLSTGNCAGSGDIKNGGNTFGSAISIGTKDGNALSFLTNNQARATIDSSGNFGIGTSGALSTLFAIGGTSGNFTVDNSGAVVAPSLTGSAALTLGSGGTSNLTLNAASGTLVLGATTVQTTDSLGYDLSKATDTTLTLNNSGAGVANLNLSDGGFQTAGTVRLTNSGALQNVTGNNTNGVSFDANTITSGTLSVARGGTGVNGSGATNGQLLIGNGSGFSIGSLTNNGGLTVTPGAGTLGLAVNYGSTSTSAVRGDTSLTCASGTGNLTGGGTVITLGSGGTCGAISTNAAVSFGTSVTTPLLTSAAGLTVSSGGTGDLTFDSASNRIVIAADDTTLQRVAAGNYTVDLKDTGLTKLVLDNSGTGTADLNLNDGALEIAGTTVLTNSRGLQNVTADTSILTAGTLGAARGGTGLDGSGATNGQLLIGNGSGFSLGSLANNGGLTVTPGVGTLGLAVNYGSSSTSAVRGDTSLTCASGTGNLSGGGTSITLGNGGTCAALDTKAAVSFGTSVTTPLLTNVGAMTINTADSTSTNTGAITIKSGNASVASGLNAGTVTLDTGTKTTTGTAIINIGNTNATTLVLGNSGTATTLNGTSLTLGAGLSALSRTAAGTTIFDLVDTSDTTFAFTNSGTGKLNLTADGSITAANGLIATAGGATITGTSSITGALTINNNANNNVDINTGISTGIVTIGGGNAPLVINSTNFDVSSTGGLSGISSYNQGSGNFTISGSGTFGTGTGAISLNGATTIATATNSANALTINGTTGTAATALVITQTGDAANLAMTNTASTSGALISLTQSTSAFTGTGLLLNFTSGSGTFASGAFLDFQLNGTSKFKVDNTGGLNISTDNTNALHVQTSGGLAYLDIDTTANQVAIGSSTTDANAILLVLDSYNGASDPTGVLGAEYYNTSSNARRCYENGYWSDCSTTRIQNDVTLAAASNTISLTLAGTETSLSCHLSSAGRTTNSIIWLRFNNVSSAGAYSYNVLQNLTGANNNTTSNSSGGATQVPLNGTSSGTNPGSYNLWINNMTAVNKTVDWTGAGSDAAGTAPNNFKGSATYFNTSSQITSVQFLTSTGNFNAGSRAWCDGR